MLNGDDEDEQKVFLTLYVSTSISFWEVLQILATSTGLQLLIPRLIVYVSEGVFLLVVFKL